MQSKMLSALMPIIASLLFAPTFAQADTQLTWSDIQGFQTSNICKTVMQKESPFQVIELAPSTLVHGFDNLSLKSNSLVKVISTSNNTGHVQIVGVPQGSGKFAGPSSEGYINTSSLKDVANYVMQLQSGAPNGNWGFPLPGTFWQAQTQGDNYVASMCGSKIYYLFNVFVAKSLMPVAQVGVEASNTSLFRSVLVLTPEQAEAAASAQDLKATTPTVTFASPRPSQKTFDSSDKIAGVPFIEGSLDQVVCSASAIQMKDDSLQKNINFASSDDSLKMIQSFGGQARKVGANGVAYVKVQVTSRGVSGWIPENQIQARSNCPFTRGQVIAEAAKISGELQGMSLGDASCCRFPVTARPTDSYKTGMRRFRASRSGRLHAACDLYRLTGDPVVAVSPGVVIRNRYTFYQGVDAIEVKHSGGFVVRYGEVMHTKVVSKIKSGTSVNTGDTVGYVGKVNSGCCKPMLHFELYSGSASGSLTGGGAFKRRKDLLDPTANLSNWEQSTFGSHW